jgi:centrosomal protein CEP41
MSDERKGTAVAQVFFEKGYENVYLISGGIEQFLEEFPDLCEGKSVPQTKKSLEESKERSMEITKKKHEECKHSPRRY